MEGCPAPWPAALRARVELVRQRLTDHFPGARIRVHEPGGHQPVAFMLRWRNGRDARVRVAWECFQEHETAEQILLPEALHSLEVGVSVLVTSQRVEIETDLDGNGIDAERLGR